MATGILPKEIAIYAVPLVTLLLGLLIGYLAQRSGYCSIGGFRDYFLFRHTRILSGYLSLIVFSFLGYLLFWFLTPAAMEHFFWALSSDPFSPVPGAPAGLVPAAYLILPQSPVSLSDLSVYCSGDALSGRPSWHQRGVTREDFSSSVCVSDPSSSPRMYPAGQCS